MTTTAQLPTNTNNTEVLMATTTAVVNPLAGHYVYAGSVHHYDRITGEPVLRIVCACGSAFVLSHVTVTPEQYIAEHARLRAELFGA